MGDKKYLAKKVQNLTCQVLKQLPVFSKVSLKVYDVLGKEVQTLVNENKSAGCHSVVWDGRDDWGESVGSGVYFYKLKAGSEFLQTKKLLFLK